MTCRFDIISRSSLRVDAYVGKFLNYYHVGRMRQPFSENEKLAFTFQLEGRENRHHSKILPIYTTVGISSR
jgi:hypothetical protein